ncbi:MAG: hypothetical protein A3G75_13645 [Verrucomicrobia bacterium RIFCSPLOWO2_12_FULL_64_8]|nr:MAG: hypothetical protein A3G75_13645 [Verrucomicrobia bacterium RIFCSPLOWO2_12_FULL_64_8]
MARITILTLLILALPGCTVTLFGHQSAGGGAAAATTSSQVSGSARVAGGRVSISSGQRVPANAQGGRVTLSRGASVLLILGLAIADTMNYMSAKFGVGPQTAPRTDSIADTCSCNGYKPPVTSDE